MKSGVLYGPESLQIKAATIRVLVNIVIFPHGFCRSGERRRQYKHLVPCLFSPVNTRKRSISLNPIVIHRSICLPVCLETSESMTRAFFAIN